MWMDNKWKSTKILLSVWFLAWFWWGYVKLISAPLSSLPFLISGLVAFVICVVCPFFIFLVWLFDSSFYKMLSRHEWIRVLVSCLAIVYGIFSHVFAATKLNEIFMVDPSYFPLTHLALTVLYFFCGWPYLIFIHFLWAVLVYKAINPGEMGDILSHKYNLKEGIKKQIGILSLSVLLLVGQTFLTVKFNSKIPVMAELFAVFADFNKAHRCTAEWDDPVDKVVFLDGGGNVLARVVGQKVEYKILPCNPR